MQRARCEQECARLALTPVFYEEGLGKHSANTRKKLPEWDKLLARALSDPAVFAVMAYDHERAFRQVTAARQTADQLAKVGVKLIFAVSGEVDNATASGKMLFTVHAAFAEHYSNYVSEKLKDHYNTLKAKGVYAGHRAPYGLKRVGKAPDVSFTPTPDLAAILTWLELYTSEETGTINGASLLNARGVRWRDRHGQLRPIAPDDLRVALNNLDAYRPFIPPALYRAAREIRNARSTPRANGHPTVYPPHLLRGILTCGRCGAPYVCNTQLSRAGRLNGYYRHHRPVLCGNIIKPSVKKVDAMVWARVAQIEWSDELRAELVDAMTTDPTPSVALDTRQAREKLERRLRNYQQMLADEDISRAQFLEHKSEIESALASLPEASPVEEAPLTRAEAVEIVANLERVLSPDSYMTPTARNQAMKALFSNVAIEGKRGGVGGNSNYSLTFTLSPLFSCLDVVH